MQKEDNPNIVEPKTTLTIQHQVTRFDLMAAYMYSIHGIPAINFSWLICATIIVALPMYEAWQGDPQVDLDGNPSLAIRLFGAGLTCIILLLLLEIFIRIMISLFAMLTSRESRFGPAEMRATDLGLEVDSVMGKALFKWSAVSKAVFTRNYLMVVFANFSLQPVRRTPDNEAALQAMKCFIDEHRELSNNRP